MKTSKFKALLVLLTTILGLTGITSTVYADKASDLKYAENAALKYVNLVEPLTKNNADYALPKLLGINGRNIKPCEQADVDSLDSYILPIWCVANNLGNPDLHLIGSYKYVSKIKNSKLSSTPRENKYNETANVWINTVVYVDNNTTYNNTIYRNRNRILTVSKINNTWTVTKQIFK